MWGLRRRSATALVLGRTDFDYVDPDEAHALRQKDLEAMLTGHPVKNEEWVRFAEDGRRALLETFPENAALTRWITKAQQLVHFQGLPARIFWLGYGERALM